MSSAPVPASVPASITQFVKEHHVLTLATCVEDEVWCAHCFYIYSPEHVSFFFASEHSTQHIKNICRNSYVGASIVLESSMVGRLRGLQIQGLVTPPDEAMLKEVRTAYHRAFPISRAMPLQLWQLMPTTMKFTDNRLGFGRKTLWERHSDFSELLASLAANNLR